MLADDGATEILSTSSIAIRFNRFLLPATALRQSVCLRADLAPITKYEDCANAIFLEPTYDPIRQEITYRQSPDQARLAPGTTYKLTVLTPASDDAITGIRAFDGAPLASSRSFEFKTAAADPAGAVLDALPTGDLFCKSKKACVAECAGSTKAVAACETAGSCTSCASQCMCDPADASCTNNCPSDDQTCFDACKACNDCQTTCRAPCAERCPESVLTALTTCAFGSCHRTDKDEAGNVLVGAAMGLELGTPEEIAATALNRVAHQTQEGEHADDVDRNPRRFGRAMPIIDSGTPGVFGGSPGNSYLLYKLAIGPSATGEAAASAEEIARLHAGMITGMPMPPEQGSPISALDLENLVTWIAQGAPTPVCQ